MAHLPMDWSGWLDLNQRHRASKARTLTKLSYTQTEGSLRLRLPVSRPLSDYPRGTNPKVPAYPPEPAEAAPASRDMTAFLSRRLYLHGIGLLDALSTVCPAEQRRLAGHRATPHQRPPAWGLGSSWISPEGDPGLRHFRSILRHVFPFTEPELNRRQMAFKAIALPTELPE